MTEKDLADIDARLASGNADSYRDAARALLAEVRRLRAERRERHQSPEQRHAAMLAYIAEHGSIQSGAYQELCDIVPDTAIRDFRDLMAAGLIGVEGMGRGTRYVLTRKGEQHPKETP